MGAKKYGGFEKYIVEEARQLKDKGYKLVVIFDVEPLATTYVDDLLRLGVVIKILPYTSKWKFIKGFYGLLREYKPEIVHTNFSSNLFVAHLLSLLCGVKQRIATEHCLPDSKSVKTKILNQLTAILANYILPVSKTSADAKLRGVLIGKNRIQTLYLGVENLTYDKSDVREVLGIADDTIALMNIAYHNPIKGVDVLLDAMDIIVNRHGISDLVLYQIGGGQTGADTEYLHNKVKTLGLEHNVIWLGIRNDAPKLLFGGDIYVQPSRSEGLPLSIMEASIASLPVVATEVGGTPEAAIAGGNALLVPSENPELLSAAIIRLYSDRILREAYGREGRGIAMENFALERNVAKLIENFYHL